jgi:hypothetical protein
MSDESKNPLDGELANDADITETHTHSEKTTSDGDTETKVTTDDMKANVPDTEGLAVDGGGPLP